MKIFLLTSIYFIFNVHVLAQIGITKSHINKAYSEIKLTATYPETWSLKTYAIYQKSKDRKCIDVAIIEIRSLNVYGVPFNSSFLCYFNNGKLIWYMDTEYTSSMVSLFNEKNINSLIEIAISGALIEGTITENELCKTKSEIEEEKVAEQKRKEEQAHQQKLAAEQKILAEKAAIVEKSKYLEIDKLMSQGKIEDANATLKTLSQPEFYPNKSKLEQSFAPIQLKNIEALLVRNNIDSAIILYNSMPESVAEKTTAEKKIQYELNTYYKTNGIPITQAAWDEIWDKGRSKLEELPPGEYKLEVLSTGEVRINGLYSGFSILWGLPKEKWHKLNRRFKYVEIQQSTLTIKKDERIDSQIFYANCTKQIAKNNTTNKYRLIKGSKHEINETIVSYEQDIDLGKNQYKIIGKVKISKLLIVKVEGQEKSIELNSLHVERTLNQGLLIK